MGIVFFCQSCGARFEVPTTSAGKKGRCRKCGQMTQIPRAEQIASMMAVPVLAGAASVAATARPAPRVATVGRAAGGSPASPPAPASLSNWLKTAASNVGLVPLSADELRPVRRVTHAPDALADTDDSRPYLLAPGTEPKHVHLPGSHAAGVAVRVWRHELGSIQRIFRWLNESAYLVSVPFIVMLLLGIVIKSRGFALFSATFVVLLNVGRLVAGVANLAVIPLRSGLDTSKYKRPINRIVEPIVTIALVLAAFTFIPWLSSERDGKGPITQRLKDTAKSLGREMEGELKTTLDKARTSDLRGIGSEIQSKLKTLGDGSQGATSKKAAPAETGKNAETQINNLIKDVGKRAREVIDESQKQP